LAQVKTISLIAAAVRDTRAGTLRDVGVSLHGAARDLQKLEQQIKQIRLDLETLEALRGSG
jgi:hypothetical protein